MQLFIVHYFDDAGKSLRKHNFQFFTKDQTLLIVSLKLKLVRLKSFHATDYVSDKILEDIEAISVVWLKIALCINLLLTLYSRTNYVSQFWHFATKQKTLSPKLFVTQAFLQLTSCSRSFILLIFAESLISWACIQTTIL